MTLAEIREWLKSFECAENYYCGRLENKKEKSLGVYNRTRSGPPVAAIGGASSYDVKSVSLLLHWNRNSRETEEAALRLWEQLRAVRQTDTPGGTHIQLLEFTVPEPVAVGTDDGGIFEYVIEFNIYYRR